MSDPTTKPPSVRLVEHPYRLFFPLGVLLAWCGVGHWAGFAMGWTQDGGSVFHSVGQIQGFMTCFVAGFLLSAIPRRTGTAPPRPWQLAVVALGTVIPTIGAWWMELAASQVAWVVAMGTLVQFAWSRFTASHAKRRPPSGFVWVPISLAFGIAGVIIMALYGALKLDFRVHDIGRLLLLQGMVLGMILGVGSMVFPLLTCGDPPPDAPIDRRWQRFLHPAAVLLLLASFGIEVQGDRATAYWLRGGTVGVVLLADARVYRWPQRKGTHRVLVWLSAWALPIGYFVGALMIPAHQAGLHIVFIGGFAMLALAVGQHVTLAHGGQNDRVMRRSKRSAAMGLLLLAAAVFRALVHVDTNHATQWIGAAAAAFLLATTIWGHSVWRGVLRTG